MHCTTNTNTKTQIYKYTNTQIQIHKYTNTEYYEVPERLVNCPTRWSLLFVFGFLYWSSSWRLGPHIGVCRLLWPLLRAGMAVLTHFFLQNVFSIYKTRAQKKFGNPVGGFTPPKKGFFPVPGPSWSFSEIVVPTWEVLRIFWKIIFLMKWSSTLTNLLENPCNHHQFLLFLLPAFLDFQKFSIYINLSFFIQFYCRPDQMITRLLELRFWKVKKANSSELNPRHDGLIIWKI